ncbi:hypothetical protein EDD11_008983 [Mortierella claussenii]|nr:hypothetical protein EDD11_008983 [Mortierella claussenii]
MLERQIDLGDGSNGTIVPVLALYSTQTGKINVTGVFYSSKEFMEPIDYTLSNDTTSNDKGDEMLSIETNVERLVIGTRLESIQIVIQHFTPLPSFRWTVAFLRHPQTNSMNFTNQDMFNQYFFQPGHFVEIQYTPLRYYEARRLGEENASSLQTFKTFMGYGGQQENFSYKSTMDIVPFQPGQYDNLTTVIVIRPQSNVEIISYAEEKITFRDTMSRIGGLIGIVGSIIVFLFGASLLSPWGYIAGLPMFRHHISGSMAKAFDTHDGYSKGPFTTEFEQTGKFDPEIRTMEQKMTLLKERIDELEMVLSEYYLNPEVFRNYAEERSKIKLARKISVLTHGTAKASFRTSLDQDDQRHLNEAGRHSRRPSRTLLESQHQHHGPLPSPQNPPSYARRTSDHRQEPEPSVAEYYQQQQQQQRKQLPYSEQSLLGITAAEDEGSTSPAQTLSPTYFDPQRRGLLQQDYHSIQQQQYQQHGQRLSRPPSFPPRPPTETVIPMTPPFGMPDNAGSVGQKKEKSIRAAPVLAPRPEVSPLFSGIGRGAVEEGSGIMTSADGNTGQFENLNMSDLSRMPREH